MSEISSLSDICKKVRETGHISGEQIIYLSKLFGRRVKNALNALKEGRVKKYVFKPSNRVAWIIVGKELEYQVIPSANFCVCDDFYFRIIDKEAKLCQHVIAQKLAEATGTYEVIQEDDRFYETLMELRRQK